MSVINILDKNTINQIAAGEVIERPASVVKELIENSIDAHATAVSCEIRGGGIDLIRITDNGSGIEEDDVRTAFIRHATSKIKDASDLVDVMSLGFRGEALASIAAVAEVELITRRKGSINGIRYCINGGEEISCENIGCPEGTTFIIRNLFGNVPVRRKFLKSAVTEGSYINDLVEKIALSHPEVSIKFINNSRTAIFTSGNNQLKDIVYGIYGREITANLVEVNHEDANGISIKGFVAKPVVARSNRNLEHYYVNGRYIRNNMISKAIEDAFSPFLMLHKYPFTVLHITVPASSMDVNVHPTKQEVRFERPDTVFTAVYTAVSEAMKRTAIIPKTITPTVDSQKEAKERTASNAFVQRAPEPFEVKRGLEHNSVPSEPKRYVNIYGDESNEPGPGFYPADKGKNPIVDLKLGSVSVSRHDNSADDNGENSSDNNVEYSSENNSENSVENSNENNSDNNVVVSTVSQISLSVNELNPTTSQDCSDEDHPNEVLSHEGRLNDDSLNEDPSKPDNSNEDLSVTGDIAGFNRVLSAGISLSGSTESYTQLVMETDFEQLGDEGIPEIRNETKDEFKKGMYDGFKIIGQLFNTYWIVQLQDKMYMIDQHAAHEKTIYERLVREYNSSEVLSQNLCPAAVVSLSAAECEIVEKNKADLQRLGFTLEPFGGREYSLSTIPIQLYKMDPNDLLQEIIDSYAEDNVRIARQTATMNWRLATCACKAAVKGNTRISVEEAYSLIKELLTLDNPFNCPHGRPVIISMTRSEIERKFKRII